MSEERERRARKRAAAREQSDSKDALIQILEQQINNKDVIIMHLEDAKKFLEGCLSSKDVQIEYLYRQIGIANNSIDVASKRIKELEAELGYVSSNSSEGDTSISS